MHMQEMMGKKLILRRSGQTSLLLHPSIAMNPRPHNQSVRLLQLKCNSHEAQLKNYPCSIGYPLLGEINSNSTNYPRILSGEVQKN
ncbi:hypothetical protein CISIN_1g034757mg [Citrus sinensis]|uniref:Uncharacterized protein n=1 Tax=Citrus sinensis TaxID=2711 RepID=A0A067F260_CITSI|nr:hypothetical protein CISIN_1g034757mg [Citrus sinensis]